MGLHEFIIVTVHHENPNQNKPTLCQTEYLYAPSIRPYFPLSFPSTSFSSPFFLSFLSLHKSSTIFSHPSISSFFRVVDAKLLVVETSIIGVPHRARVVRVGAVGVHAARVFGILVDGGSPFIFWQEFFDFPVVLFGTYGELEVFAGY